VVGTLPADAGNGALYGGLDIDNHDDDPATARANRKAARHWYGRLAGMGFRPLLTDSDGKGGYHLFVLLSGRVDGARVRQFLTTLTDDYPTLGLTQRPELFPKQDDVRRCAKGLGNWMRAPGRHHKRPHWARLWDGKRWLEGRGAVDFILTLDGDDPGLLAELPAGSDCPPSRNGRSGRAAGLPTPIPLGCAEYAGYARLTNEVNPPPAPTLRSDKPTWQAVKQLARDPKCQPRPGRKRHLAVFSYAQAVKGLPVPDGYWTTPRLVEAFAPWWRNAEPKVSTKDYDFNLSEFIEAFDRCRHPGGMDWGLLAEEAKDEPLPAAAAKKCPRPSQFVCCSPPTRRRYASWTRAVGWSVWPGFSWAKRWAASLRSSS
jgi:hypothetical protein